MSSVDELPFGAAAPSSRRLIGSRHVLDALWVLAVSSGIVFSSFFDLLDFGDLSVRTGTAPLRVFSIGLPVLAAVTAVGGAVVKRPALAAAGAGLVIPAAASVGLVGSSFFLSNNVGLVDVGAALSVGAALIGSFMSARWFVYHPDQVSDEAARPTGPLRSIMAAAGGVAALSTLVRWPSGQENFAASDLLSLTFALLPPFVVVVAALTRTPASFVLGAACAAGHVAAALVAARDTDADAFVNDVYSLWTGPIGMVALAVAAALGVAGQFIQAEDVPPAIDDIDETWRWTVD